MKTTIRLCAFLLSALLLASCSMQEQSWWPSSPKEMHKNHSQKKKK